MYARSTPYTFSFIVPIAPMITSVMGVSSSAVQVVWMPNQPNIDGPGAITHYTVYVNSNDMGMDTDGVVMSYNITDLEPFMEVMVEVSASTSIGEGLRSPMFPGRSNEARKY